MLFRSEIKVVEREVPSTFRKKIYDSRIEYLYSVNGKEYKGNQQNIGNLNTSSRSRDKAVQQANKFTEDQEVMVYYNSSKPEISSLSVGVERNLFVQFVFGFIFLFLGVTLFRIGIYTVFGK